ncbi:MAG: holo-ACP synthase [Microbacteriaceae bacterium]|nr:holo-ACP synthase [Microbacteriaceae bacterium]
MIVGIGVDVVDLARFERAATRTPKVIDRLFAQSEQGAQSEQSEQGAQSEQSAMSGLAALAEQNDRAEPAEPAEQGAADRILSLRSLAGRFAAKEALIKALGSSDDVHWHDLRVVSDEHGNPSFALSGGVAARAAARNIGHFHLSITHDAGIAMAFVVAESA